MVLMANVRTSGMHDFNLASRKAEEAALRRYQAVHWLECLVCPLGVADQPSEKEFISCLRNGLILCNAINKIQPGSVPKVVESHLATQSLPWDSQPLPAYQYFENVRNFLMVVKELKLPAFDASDLETEAYEAGSAGRVVDCILALKAYHEWRQINGGNGVSKCTKSPLLPNSRSGNFSRPLKLSSANAHRHLNMPIVDESLSLEDSVVKALADCMVNGKENIDDNLLASFHTKNLDPVKGLSKILASCMDAKLENTVELKSSLHDILREQTGSVCKSTSTPMRKLPTNTSAGQCRACLTKGSCDHWKLLQRQEIDLFDLKALLSQTKEEFEHLQSQLLNDLKQLENQVKDMSTAALGYHKVVQENRSLYNLVQDLKGNIRVYCRVRPIFDTEANNVIDFIGEDGSVIVVDPSKSQKDGRKVFQFNRVFGPTATQDDVFKDTQPLIRSVMDGYNVCILAYGQTGSGKTYTMCGPSSGSTKDMGINSFALNDLFEMSYQRKDVISYDILAQMVEIYNEQVRDLLAEDSSSTKLDIRSHPSNGGMGFPDAVLHPVKSTHDILNLMKLGEGNRAVCSTAMNNQSSRSHSILTVHVHGKYTSGGTLHSCLHLVDLAGSERVDKSEVSGDRLKEAQHINKSLSCLGDVFFALSQKSSYIPYRNSKLTLLLQDALGGNAKTLMFAHVSPEGDDFSETIGTLKFAQRVSSVELGAACLNKQSSEVMELKQQIEHLKKALMKKEAINFPLNRHPISPCEKPKIASDRTPPRSRRLSIESKKEPSRSTIGIAPLQSRRTGLEHPSSAVKSEMLSSAIPKPRRLSIENSRTVKHDAVENLESEERVRSRRLSAGNPHSMNSEKILLELSVPSSRRSGTENNTIVKIGKLQHAEPGVLKEHKSSGQGKSGTTDRTPPRLRLLSIEKPSTMKSEKMMGTEIRKGYKTSSTATKHVTESSTTRARRLSLEEHRNGKKKCFQIEMPEDMCKFSDSNSDLCSPEPVSTCLGQPALAEYATEPPFFQPPITPEPIILCGDDFEIAMDGDFNIGNDLQTPGAIRSTHGKGSQIKKSLRTIGKLINGSDKRSRNVIRETQSAVKTSSTALRRLSLAGNQSSGPDNLRRSSLGEKSSDACMSETRNAKSPPPSLQSSTKMAHRRT